MGNAKLTYEELETVLVEIESIINCRPLTYLFEDEAEEALTPSHLAIGRRLVTPITRVETSDEQSHESLTARYKYLQTIIEHYWKRFSKEYLLELHQHHLNVHKGNYDELCQLLLGDVVLIKDDSFKRNCWKKGKVEQLISGEDGHVRGAVLKVNTSGRNSFIRRPVQKIIPLEVQRQRSNSPSDSSSEQIIVATDDDSASESPCENVSKRGRKRFRTDRYQAS